MKTHDTEQCYGEEERIDTLDHLIFHEIGQQSQWVQTMQMWEERARQQRRRRLLPVFSNIASVAALFILGFIVEAMMPDVKVTDSITDTPSQTEQAVSPTQTPGQQLTTPALTGDSTRCP